MVGILQSAIRDLKESYNRDFLSGKKSPERFVEDYESSGWFHKNFWIGCGDNRIKYEIARDIVNSGIMDMLKDHPYKLEEIISEIISPENPYLKFMPNKDLSSC